MREMNAESAQRRLEALGPALDGWDKLSLNDKIEHYPDFYFAEVRVLSFAEAKRQIAEEAATARELAVRALTQTQE